MTEFRVRKLLEGAELLAGELVAARKRLNKELKEVSRELKISTVYLEAIESGRLDKLPKGLYGRKIIKEYALYLGVDLKYVLALFDDEVQKQPSGEVNPFAQKTPKKHLFITVPKIIKSIVIVVIVFLCIAYLGYYVKNIVSAPSLVVYLDDDITISDSSLKLAGHTDKEADVSVNGEVVLKDGSGDFVKEVYLKSGVNTITITSRKKYSRTNTIVKKVLVDKEYLQ